MESKADEADSLMDMSQTLLQLLGSALPSGLSPLLFAQAASGSLAPAAAAAAAQMSLPWILPAQYQQFVVLQQGLAQQLLGPGVSECDGQGEATTDRAGNQLEATAEANPLLAAILQRHTMTQKQLQELDDSDRNATALSLSPSSSLLTAAGVPSVQFEGLSGQTGMWSKGTNDKAQGGIFQERLQQPQQLQSHQQCQQLQEQRPRPPKKPLTPYMIFSKEIWHQVKAANSHLSSVTEIGAIIGRLWRDLDAEKKEQYNEMFNDNKVRYEDEMRVYLKQNNLRPSDLTRSKIPRRHSSPSSHSGFAKSHETTKQIALGKLADGFNSSDQSFRGHLVQQQLLGQMSFSGGETVFPSGTPVADNSAVVSQTQNEIISAQGPDELVHVSTISPSDSSVNLGKCANSTETTMTAWTWHQPVSLGNDSHSQTLTTETGVTLTETSSASTQARYYSTDGLDQLLKLKEQNVDKFRELAHINDLEMQIFHLESALTERIQKADELRQELEAANLLIAHLQEQQSSSLMESVDAETLT